MTSFRYPVAVKRRAPGVWVGPDFVPGAEIDDTILATVQPVSLSDYDVMQALPEGRRVEAVIRIYSDTPLTQAGKTGDTSGDLVTWPDGLHGRDYEVIAVSPWQSRILPHYRMLAALLIEPRAI